MLVFGGQLRETVDGAVAAGACVGGGEGAVALILISDLVEIHLLGGIVGGAEMGRTFEHQMLQIMSQSCRLGRVVSATRLDGDIGLDAWFLFVDGEIYLQSVFQRVDTCLRQVAFHLFVTIVLGLHTCGTRQQECQQRYFSESFFHTSFISFYYFDMLSFLSSYLPLFYEFRFISDSIFARKAASSDSSTSPRANSLSASSLTAFSHCLLAMS